MRRSARARGPFCALALLSVLSLSPTVLAEGDKKPPKKSLESCTSFGQHDRAEEDGVDLSVTSTCEIKLQCSISWAVTCAPGTKKAKRTRGAATFELDTGGTDGATASAAHCGVYGWEVADIKWSCKPAM